MSFDAEIVQDTARYRTLGLIANPFDVPVDSVELAVDCEIAAASHSLLGTILAASFEETPKPIWVDKTTEVPAAYHNRAIAEVEHTLATDEDFNVLYAYVPLFSMKVGVTRATLMLLAERLAFRGFDQTLALWLDKVFAHPDTSLASYQMLDPDRLATFESAFMADRMATVHEVFGAPELERRPELAEVNDLRHLSMDEDVATETESTDEIDETVGDAPGTNQLLEEAAQQVDADNEAFVDYVIEYTSTHMSAVIARALRVYRDRGLAALAAELKITKAPRKTLAAVISFARLRYRKVALLYDGFNDWLQIESDLRARIISTLSDIRWKSATDAVMVFLVEPDTAPELEETFGGGVRVAWDFPQLMPIVEAQGALVPPAVDEWLVAAAAPGAEPLTVATTPAFGKLSDIAEGSMDRFCALARTAVDDAADRGVSTLDEESVSAAQAARDALDAASETVD